MFHGLDKYKNKINNNPLLWMERYKTYYINQTSTIGKQMSVFTVLQNL